MYVKIYRVGAFVNWLNWGENAGEWTTFIWSFQRKKSVKAVARIRLLIFYVYTKNEENVAIMQCKVRNG